MQWLDFDGMHPTRDAGIRDDAEAHVLAETQLSEAGAAYALSGEEHFRRRAARLNESIAAITQKPSYRPLHRPAHIPRLNRLAGQGREGRLGVACALGG